MAGTGEPGAEADAVKPGAVLAALGGQNYSDLKLSRNERLAGD
jgi:hypothetical protein